MQNLKIQVNSADESKEIQNILESKGFKKWIGWSELGSIGGFIWTDSDMTYCDNKIEYFDESPRKEITLPELRTMANQDQNEPFLTPECTLSDQYAEIEQVRQAIKVKSGSDSDHALDAMSFGLIGAGAAQAVGGVDATLTERQSQYGCYEDVAHVTQQILSVLRVGNYDELPAPMKESLHMIASKMARIVNGDPEYLDNWHDIGGYAKLIEKLIKGE